MHRVRDGDRHQDEQRRAAFAVEVQADPAREAESGQEDRDNHNADGDDPPERAQQKYGNDQHRRECDRCQNARVLVQRVAEGSVQQKFADKVVFDRRMLRPLLRGGAPEKVDGFDLGRLAVFIGKHHADDQPGDAAVARNQAPRYLFGLEGDSLNSL